jgi:hypothetical protein
MGEERYWIVHGRVSTSIHPDADGHPALRAVCQRHGPDAAMDDHVARISAEARARGNVALFRDHWAPRAWGGLAPVRAAQAGPLADDFRPRRLPRQPDSDPPRPPATAA